jgi:dihydrolipoamide dehydrogenase
MKQYDVVVVGSGCGMIIVDEAAAHGLKVALIDKGPFGGTCLNLGCIPSKMLIYVADKIVEMQEAKKLGVDIEIKAVDFKSVIKRMRKSIEEARNHGRREIARSHDLDFYEGEGHFIAEYTIAVNDQKIKGKKIFLASGSRPLIPGIKGLDTIDYLTNETVLQLNERPDSLIIIGGGYISVEYGHFFAAMGTKVTILEMAERIVLPEEPEISELLKKALSRRMDVYTNVQAQEVKKTGDGAMVVVQDKDAGQLKEFTAQRILVAVGRRSNADLLKTENIGLQLDEKGFIKVDGHLRTNKKNIFAVGDANGQQMFTHVANKEAALAVSNTVHGTRLEMDYSAAPHAVYSYPQIASVGLTQEKAMKDHDILVSRTKYSDVAKGEAMMEKEGFAKIVVEKQSMKILGFHIIGPYAPELIQEVVNAMESGGRTRQITGSMHIHPALSELIPQAISDLVS